MAGGVDGFPDDEPSARYPVYTRGNVGEIVPTALSPMSLSVSWVLEQAQRDAFERMGAMRRDELGDGRVVFPCFNGYAYLNLSVMRVVALRLPGMTTELIDRAVAMHADLPPHEPHPDDNDPDAMARMAATLQWAMAVRDLPEVDDAEHAVDELRRTRPDLITLTPGELLERFRDTVELGRDAWARHLFISFVGAIPMGALMMMTGTTEMTEDLLAVPGGRGDIVSAAPSYQLWDLGRAVTASPALTAAFDGGVDGLLTRLEEATDADSRQFLAGFRSFLVEFGYRGVNEAEIASDTWETRPELALTLVDRLRAASGPDSPEARRLASAERGAAARARLTAPFADNEAGRQMVDSLVHAGHTFESARERTKAIGIRLGHEGRVVAREVGRRMVEAGHLDAVNDVAMLRIDELHDFLADPGAFRDRITRRREHYDRLNSLLPPFVVHGQVPPLDTWVPRAEAAADSQVGAGTVLEGLAGSAGVGTGPARVITDLTGTLTIEPGDVLVAPFTDAAWTPLFVPAAAVVVEVGGHVSHAVVVAREFGIPCVVSVGGATRKIRDGAMVRVDGTQGHVTVL